MVVTSRLSFFMSRRIGFLGRRAGGAVGSIGLSGVEPRELLSLLSWESHDSFSLADPLQNSCSRLAYLDGFGLMLGVVYGRDCF